jgi:CBS domain-containing protein/anti-sigma regulatory factor (Ser/Thr protein kinase)
MQKNFPISPDDSQDKTPFLTTEIIFRMKVKDAMITDVLSAKKDDSFDTIQEIMKVNGISGLPVVDELRIIGMISVNDIINALQGGYMNAQIDQYMSKQVVVLEDDMPLTFAVSYFNKYQYRRFPVINKQKELVGLLTTKDVLSALLNEMNKEINLLESKLHPEKTELPNQIVREFLVKQFDFENAGSASFALKKLLKEKEISRKTIRRCSVAAYELEINIAIHSNGGKLTFYISPESITIIAQDTGPGIKDVSQVLKEGYSTANEWIRSLGFGAGMGIPNTKRVSDEFDMESEFGKGTTVKSVIYLEEDNENQ